MPHLPTQYTHDVFLSFSIKDTEKAKKIWNDLSECGLLVFWSDGSLKRELGKSWFDKVEHSLENSQHMVLLVTQNSLKSKWVLREYKAFLNSCYEENKRRMIPILDSDVEVQDMPLFMREFQNFRVKETGAIRRMSELLKESSERLKNMVSEEKALSGAKNPESEYGADDKTSVIKSGYQEEKVEKNILEGKKYGVFVDPRDNTSYKTIDIGNHTWLAENLKFRSTESKTYRNNPELEKLYGRLYSWDDALNSCPPGWRIPDYHEWDELINITGGYYKAGKQLILPGKGFPVDKDPVLQGDAGFNAIYAGMSMEEVFTGLDKKGYFWSSEEYDADHAWRYVLGIYYPNVYKEYREKYLFFSVRCIKDS